MKGLLGLLLLYIVIKLGMIAVGVGIGFLLHWLLPSVELGTSILIAVVATGFSIHYFIRLLELIEVHELSRFEDDDLPPIEVYPRSGPRSGRGRRRK